MDTAVLPRPLSRDEALALTEQINSTAGLLWELMLEAYEREAWRALHYDNWQAYAKAEFNMGRSRAYQLLDQGRVVRALQAASNSTMVELTERTAREIRPVLPQVENEVRERVAAGEEPAAAVREAVATRRPAKPAPAHEAEDDHTPDLTAELEEAAREIDRLAALTDSLQKSEQGREIVAWSAKYAALEGRLRHAMDTAQKAKRESEYQAGVLKKIRAALGVEKNAEILDAIADLRR